MIADLLRREVERGLKRALTPMVIYLKGLLIGLNLLAFAVIGYVFALGFASVGLYFAILHTTVNAVAAVWVAGAWLLVAVVLTALGSSRIRPPR